MHKYLQLIAVPLCIASAALIPAFGLAAPASAVEAAAAPDAGAVCTVADGWWGLKGRALQQPEQVRIVKVQHLSTGEAGLWVQPLRGPLAEYQFQIASRRIQYCAAKA